MDEQQLSVISNGNKLKQLEAISNGTVKSVDSSELKSKIASFLVAYADKVMDTVGPLEQLRDILAEEYITKAQEIMEDPEATAGTIAKLIQNIQEMNTYSISTLKSMLDADKLQTYISIDASSNNSGNVNVLNLDNAQSRAKVLKAVSDINKLINAEKDNDVIELKEDE